MSVYLKLYVILMLPVKLSDLKLHALSIKKYLLLLLPSGYELNKRCQETLKLI